MSRIKLRNLIYLTELAPQAPPLGIDPMTPAAAPVQPGMNAGQPEQSEQPETPPAPDTSPEPEDPGEYDFTKDFRAFEDKKNKSESDAKKVLMDKMNERLLGKTIVANASRGYGQPKTDYTIEGIKKISVEFWYKDYVVIAADENDKKYFLTPGINIKIEQGAEEPGAAPEGEQPGGEQSEVPGQEQPGAELGQEEPNAGGSPAPGPGGVVPAQQAEPEPEVPVAPNQEPQTQPSPIAAKPNVAPPIDPRKKKKKLPQPVAEETNGEDENEYGGVRMKHIGPHAAQRDLAKFFVGYLNLQRLDLTPYVRKSVSSGRDEDGGYHTEYILEIPKEILGNNFDARDFSLEFRNEERRSGGPGQPFSRGFVEIQPRGRFYTFRFSLSGGLDI